MTDPVRLREFETLERPAGAFSAQDVDALYHQFGSQIRIEWPTPATGGQWRLTPGGWVGIFPASKDLTVIVEPKVPLRSVFAMWEWAYDLSQFRVLDGAQPVTTFEEFYSQMARILAAQVLARGRKGLAREYVGFDEPLPVIRGRLDVPALIRRPWATQPVCHYHEHTPDIADNQILAWTLGGILHAPACNLAARPVVRQAFMMLRHAVDARPFAARDAAGRRYTRLTADYAPMHALCRFFIEHSGPSQQSGERDMLPFIVGTAELFELFVARWLEARLPKQYRLHRQERVDISAAHHIQFQIDLVIVDSGTGRALAVLDTKYKDVTAPSTQDISQVVAYAEAKGCERAALVYPAQPDARATLGVGLKRITPLVFDLSQDVEVAGKAFLQQLEAMLNTP